MTNTTRVIRVQMQSFGNYLKDMWLVALLLVLFQHETSSSLPFIWIALQIIIATFSQLIYRKTGPNSLLAIMVPSIVLLLLFSVGSPFWLYVISLGVSSWRIYARYNTAQDELSLDSNYTLLLFLTFLTVYFYSYFMRFEGYSKILFILLVSGIVLFMGIRIFTIYLNTERENLHSIFRIFVIYLTGITFISGLSVFLFIIVDEIRELLSFVLAAIVGILVIPFGPVIQYLLEFVERLKIDPIKPSETLPSGVEAEIEKVETVSEVISTGFPLEWIILGVIVLIIIFVVLLIMKRKPEKLEVELHHIQYEKKSMLPEKEVITKDHPLLYQVETSLLREKYILFEQEAHTYELGRVKSETVREWFERKNWIVEEEFFRIYENVRYGGHSIESHKADLFIKTLESAKVQFFIKKDV